MVKEGGTLTSHQKFFGKDVKSPISNREKVMSNLADCGKPCIWLGYAADHAQCTDRVYIILTHDAVLLWKSYGEWNADKDEAITVKQQLFKMMTTLVMRKNLSTLIIGR